MTPLLSFPWLVALVLVPALGVAASLLVPRRAERALLLWTCAVAFGLATAAALDFRVGGTAIRIDPLDPGMRLVGRPFLFVDELSFLLLPFGALLFGVVALILPRTERVPGSTSRMLAAEAAVLGMFSTAEPALLAVFWLLFATMVPPQRSVGDVAHGSRRVVASYMIVGTVCLVLGVAAGYAAPASSTIGRVGATLVVAAVMTRKGIMPLHSWMISFFERAALPEAVLFSAPQIGAYVAARLVVPHAAPGVLTVIVIASLATAVYGAGLALVQTDAHRAFGAFFMSQSALVMTGLHSGTVLGVAGGLSLWISSGLALTGFAMALAALEARRGALSLRTYAGGYERTPFLATSFLLLGLAAVGFPGTLGFVGEEALVEGVAGGHPLTGIAVLVTSALNGLLVLRAFFLLFGGARPPRAAHQITRLRERAGFLTLVLVLIVAGVAPRPFLASREHAAEAVIRPSRALPGPSPDDREEETATGPGWTAWNHCCAT